MARNRDDEPRQRELGFLPRYPSAWAAATTGVL